MMPVQPTTQIDKPSLVAGARLKIKLWPFERGARPWKAENGAEVLSRTSVEGRHSDTVAGKANQKQCLSSSTNSSKLVMNKPYTPIPEPAKKARLDITDSAV